MTINSTDNNVHDNIKNNSPNMNTSLNMNRESLLWYSMVLGPVAPPAAQESRVEATFHD